MEWTQVTIFTVGPEAAPLWHPTPSGGDLWKEGEEQEGKESGEYREEDEREERERNAGIEVKLHVHVHISVHEQSYHTYGSRCT